MFTTLIIILHVTGLLSVRTSGSYREGVEVRVVGDHMDERHTKNRSDSIKTMSGETSDHCGSKLEAVDRVPVGGTLSGRPQAIGEGQKLRRRPK
jgi:hypothetical protein